MGYLQTGDVFLLEKGMTIYGLIPEKFVYSNKPFSDELTSHDIKVDVTYTNEEVTKRNVKEEANHISNQIFRLFLDNGYSINFEDCKKFTQAHIDVEKKLESYSFKFEGGLFKVTNTALEGGGRAMFNDYYPDGWHVHAVRLINELPSTKKEDIIHFYQSGSFTAMNEEIKPIENY
jgi:hypothetical protein